jgi:hypothetical protein
MVKYHLSAIALKSFSSCTPARRLYRRLGNWMGGRRRSTAHMPSCYFERAERNIAWCLKYGLLRKDDLVVEIGTGWVHWEALTMRLFFDFQAVLYDVWDNRQLDALKSYVSQLEGRFGQKGFLEHCDLDHARSLIKKIQAVRSFDHLYEILGFRYVLDPTGLMECLPRDAFRLAISAGVMEHISATTAPQFVSSMASLLVKKGFGIHGINISDHLSLYDPSANPKQYLTYSEFQWRLWFENAVQYINRIQRSDWLQMFDDAGLSVVEEKCSYADLAGLQIDPRYLKLSRKDLSCTTMVLVAQKS